MDYCGSRWGRCVLFINIWDSLTAPCLYNGMYTVYGRCGQYGQCMFIHWPVRGLYGPAGSITYIGLEALGSLIINSCISNPLAVNNNSAVGLAVAFTHPESGQAGF